LKLWPTFIGTSLTNDRKEVGRLPVLLWSVQKRYLEKNRQSEKNESVRGGQKRKRREEDVMSENNEEIVAKKSRSSSYWSDLWSHIKSVLEGFTLNRMHPPIEQQAEEAKDDSTNLHRDEFDQNRILQRGGESKVSLIRQMVLTLPSLFSLPHSHIPPPHRSLLISCPQLELDLCGRRRMTQRILLPGVVI
jgi:hypothetical protein